MNAIRYLKTRIRGVLRGLLSVPVFVKVMGIGMLVAVVFGTVTLTQVRRSMSRALHASQEQLARSAARSLANGIERPLTVGDSLLVQQRLSEFQLASPGVRYIVVQDGRGHICNHTFETAVPESLVEVIAENESGQDGFTVLGTPKGKVFHVTCPILDGRAGSVHVGLSDDAIRRELQALTLAVLWSLLLCVVIGTGLAAGLTDVLTQPIQRLVQVATRIRDGDFTARAEAGYDDEIGHLTYAFNETAEALQQFKNEVSEREQARQALLEKIVHAQEDERRSISRELHDELGQSLLAVLLTLQTQGSHDGLPAAEVRELALRVRSMIDEVRRLAWGMHPSILDDYGLESALARHVQEISHNAELDIDYQYTTLPNQGRVPREIEVTLYRVAQEAITNVLRHSEARHCSVVILQGSREVTLLIEDDGCGFDSTVLLERDGRGLGLTGMKERVSMVGGRCEIESAAGTGTTIRIRIPLKEDSACLHAS